MHKSFLVFGGGNRSNGSFLQVVAMTLDLAITRGGNVLPIDLAALASSRQWRRFSTALGFLGDDFLSQQRTFLTKEDSP